MSENSEDVKQLLALVEMMHKDTQKVPVDDPVIEEYRKTMMAMFDRLKGQVSPAHMIIMAGQFLGFAVLPLNSALRSPAMMLATQIAMANVVEHEKRSKAQRSKAN